MKIRILVTLLLFIGKVQTLSASPIEFVQKKHIRVCQNLVDSVFLDRREFSIQFSQSSYTDNSWHATRISFMLYENDFKGLRPGVRLDDVPFFSGGTGMAPDENNYYRYAMINQLAHHYLYYQNDADTRMKRIKNRGDEQWFQWKIQGIQLSEQVYSFSELPVKAIWCIVCYDKNLNELIERDELHVVKIIFRD